MSGASRRVRTGQQVNFTLDAHWRLVLRLAAEADNVSAPDLIRPVVMRYLRYRMRDEDLREAVARMEHAKRSRRGTPDNVTPLSDVTRKSGRKRAEPQRDEDHPAN